MIVHVVYYNCNNIMVRSINRWGSYFLKVTRYLLLLRTAKNISLQLHITYLENKVTVIILHTIIIIIITSSDDIQPSTVVSDQ